MCWVQGLLVAVMQVKKSSMTQYFLYAAVICFVEGLQARSLKGGVLL